MIAVVNMDDGVSVNQVQVNYANQLMNFPGENFSVTGLMNARAGIENGTYAAYIIISETNDNAEMGRLEDVNADLLIEAAERVEATVVDNDIQTLELAFYPVQNDSLSDSMLSKYMEAVQQAQNDSTQIQGTRNEVDAASNQKFSVYHSVVYDTNEVLNAVHTGV